MNASHRFMHNTHCEYSPCHEGLAPKDINCLFCYCPFYFVSNPLHHGSCPGTPVFLPNGIKDCSSCTYPHKAENYDELVVELKKRIDSMALREVILHAKDLSTN
jgi:Zn-finger protein